MLKQVVWDNYGVLKNLDLNLTDLKGNPYNTIVLAGENGTGKTTILDTLATFLNLGTFVPFKQIVYSTVFTDYSLVKIKNENFDKPYTFNNHKYETLSTYIRNCIDHPKPQYSYSEDELRISILLLRELLMALNN